MFEGITEVIGFDLGHGDTALTRLYLGDMDNTSEPEIIEIFPGIKKIPTAIGYLPDGKVLIGESALRKPGVIKSFIAFKKRPNSNDEYQENMNKFIGKIYEQKTEQNQINGASTFFIVGCPSEWTQHVSMLEAYQKLFIDAGIENVKVVAESRAAFIQASEKQQFILNELAGSLIVIDLGSSTTDITIIDPDRNSIPIDFGRDIGASFIEKKILELTLANLDQDKILSLYESSAHFRTQYEYLCRRTKEAFFSTPERFSNPDEPCVLVERLDRNTYYEAATDASMIKQILTTPCIDNGVDKISWIQAFRDELTKLKHDLEYRHHLDETRSLLPGAILLTGGASRMNFVRDLCQEVFPDLPVKQDDTPEYCIARGLARWGRIEIQTSKFTQDINDFCLHSITPQVEDHIDALYEKLSSALANKIIVILKEKFSLWKTRDLYTISDMQNSIDKDVNELLQERKLAGLITEQISPILEEISKNLQADIRQLEDEYHIPYGQLANTFNFEHLNSVELSLGCRSKLNAADDMISDLSEAVGLIAGVLVTVAAWGMRGVIYTITVYTVGIIVTVLAGVFVSNPLGWGILASLGISVFVTGKSATAVKKAAQEAIEEKLPTWDLPMPLRRLVKENTVYEKINEQRSEVYNQLTSSLKKDENVRQQLVEKISGLYENSLREKAEEMRLLIS